MDFIWQKFKRFIKKGFIVPYNQNMNIQQLEQTLQGLGVKERNFSVSGNSKPDAIILNHYLAIWEVFYFDERGGRNDEKKFSTESDACEEMLNRFLSLIETKKKFGLKPF